MAKNDANKEGVFLGPPRSPLTTVGVLGFTEVVSGKRPVDYSTRTSPSMWDGLTFEGERRTGVVKPTANMKAR